MFATHSSIHPISHITWQICQALIIVEEEMELGSIMAVKLSIGMHGLPSPMVYCVLTIHQYPLGSWVAIASHLNWTNLQIIAEAGKHTCLYCQVQYQKQHRYFGVFDTAAL